MNPLEQALYDGGGGGLLTIMASPYMTVLMWVVPVGLEIAFVWAVYYLWRRRRPARTKGEGLPGQPVSAPQPSRAPLVIRERNGR